MDNPTDYQAFNTYQAFALRIAQYPGVGENMVYPAMGVAGEAGELCDKIKKHWRNTNAHIADLPTLLTAEQRQEIIKEMGDVLWYLAALANELDVQLGHVACMNIEKLQSRTARGVIKGEGDNR